MKIVSYTDIKHLNERVHVLDLSSGVTRTLPQCDDIINKVDGEVYNADNTPDDYSCLATRQSYPVVRLSSCIGLSERIKIGDTYTLGMRGREDCKRPCVWINKAGHYEFSVKMGYERYVVPSKQKMERGVANVSCFLYLCINGVPAVRISDLHYTAMDYEVWLTEGSSMDLSTISLDTVYTEGDALRMVFGFETDTFVRNKFEVEVELTSNGVFRVTNGDMHSYIPSGLAKLGWDSTKMARHAILGNTFGEIVEV